MDNAEHVTQKEFTSVRGDVEETKADVKLILTNHLPHMNERLAVHGSQLGWILKASIAILGAAAVQIMALIFTK